MNDKLIWQMSAPVAFGLNTSRDSIVSDWDFSEGELPSLHSRTPGTIPDGGPSGRPNTVADMNDEFSDPEWDTLNPGDLTDMATSSTNDSRMQDVDVVHPWKIVDYQLYLSSSKGGEDAESRRNRVYLYDGDDCCPLVYREMREGRAFDNFLVRGQPKLLFAVLPIPGPDASFDGMSYVLGFDCFTRTFFARFFSWVPEHIDDLWSIWDDGCDTYSLTILGLVQLFKTTFNNTGGDVSVGILSSSPYCISRHANDDPGMELVIAILYGQWVVDFAEVLFHQEQSLIDDLKKEFDDYLDKCRAILERASYKAWSSISNGTPARPIKGKSLVNRYTNDLYTFSESIDEGSLRGHEWHAPSIDICNQLREDNRNLLREQAEKRFEKLFARPESDTVSPDEVLEKMLARTRSEDYERLLPLWENPAPRTPSPSGYPFVEVENAILEDYV